MSRPPLHDPLDVLTLHARGYTAPQAAEHLGVTVWTVRETARQMGLRFRDRRTVPDDVQARVVAMRKAGATLDAIAQEVGLSRSGVHKVLGRAG